MIPFHRKPSFAWHRIRPTWLALQYGATIALLSSCSSGGGSTPAVPAQASSPRAAGATASPIPPNGPTSQVSFVPSPVSAVVMAPSAMPTLATTSTSTAPVPVTMTYAFGSYGTTVQSGAAQRAAQGASFVGYTSTAAPITISLIVTPLGGASSTYTGSCSAASTGTSGTCAVTFTAAPGPTTFAGVITATGNTIASFSQLQIVSPGTANAMNFTANPVVSSVALQLAATSVNAGTASDTLLTVKALDANGNIIAGKTPYVDSSGNRISLLLNVTNAQAGGRGRVYLNGPTRVNAPGQASIYAHYDGNWLQSSTINLSSTSPLVASTTATLGITPHAYEYAVAGGPVSIIAGPNGNLWFTEYNAASIGTITPSGTGYLQYSCGACSSPHWITIGPDGNMWFTEEGGAHVSKITTSGASTRVAVTSGGGGRIRTGPDGNLWYSSTSTGNIGKVTLNGIETHYPTGGGTRGLAWGPDGNLWYASQGTTIGKMSSEGTIRATYTVGSLYPYSDGVTTGQDGNLWFVLQGANQIDKVSTSGVIASYNLQANAAPWDIIGGTDGSLWFTESGTASIGRLTTSGTLVEYGAAYGITAASKPIGISVGPDGNIWFAENIANKVVKFVY